MQQQDRCSRKSFIPCSCNTPWLCYFVSLVPGGAGALQGQGVVVGQERLPFCPTLARRIDLPGDGNPLSPSPQQPHRDKPGPQSRQECPVLGAS